MKPYLFIPSSFLPSFLPLQAPTQSRSMEQEKRMGVGVCVYSILNGRESGSRNPWARIVDSRPKNARHPQPSSNNGICECFPTRESWG